MEMTAGVQCSGLHADLSILSCGSDQDVIIQVPECFYNDSFIFEPSAPGRMAIRLKYRVDLLKRKTVNITGQC